MSSLVVSRVPTIAIPSRFRLTVMLSQNWMGVLERSFQRFRQPPLLSTFKLFSQKIHHAYFIYQAGIVAQKTTSLQITYPCDVLDWLGLDFVFDSLYLESAYKTIIIC